MTSDPAGLYTAALTLTNERRYREAEAALDAAASGADDNPRPRIAGTRAFVLDQLGRPDEGEALCRRVLAGDALTAHTRGVIEGQLGSILMHRGRLDEGLEWLGRAIDTIPDDPLAVANLRMNRSLVAMQRGNAIITGTALGSSTTNGEWAQASGVVLGRLLHAAAVGGMSIAELYDWGTSPAQTRDAVEILKADGAPGWGDSLDATIAGDEKLVSSIWFGVSGAVAPLAVPQIRDALSPRSGDPALDPLSFLDAGNTLYLIGSSSGASAMGGWLGAVLDDIVEVARKRALALPGARLTHPLGLILDEIANMFRWGSLPRIMADGGGLKPTSQGRRVAFDGDGRRVIDGPFAPASEQVAGFWVWNVRDMAEAVEWAKRCPNPMPGPSELEIRPFYEDADFA